MILPDVLDYNLNIVFCGMAASKKSKELQAYYAGPGNKFYKTLNTINLTNEVIIPKAYKELLNYNIGLTDICKTDYGNDDELNSQKYDPSGLLTKITKYQPRMLCFNGKMASKVYFNTKNVNYGLQKQTIGKTKLFIAPSTSGAANGFWNLSIWKQLADF